MCLFEWVVPAGGIITVMKTIACDICLLLPTISPIEIGQIIESRPTSGLDKAIIIDTCVANPSSIHTKHVWLSLPSPSL